MVSPRHEFFTQFLKERSGLVLTEDKGYLLESRLVPLAKKNGLDGLDALVKQLEAEPKGALAELVTDAMTTNETFFFRDGKPFDHFRDVVLPHLIENHGKDKRLRIWCAAASTGQEPYTLAMILNEDARLKDWKVDLIATDISSQALDRARKGLYTQFEVQRGLPIQMLVKYFKKKSDMWQISEEITSMVKFQNVNLLDSFTSLGRFNVVFCRNVLIYFEPATKSEILERISRQMASDGLLFLGGAETIFGVSECFTIIPDQRGIYGVDPDCGAEAAS